MARIRSSTDLRAAEQAAHTAAAAILQRRERYDPQRSDLDRFPDPTDLMGVATAVAKYRRVDAGTRAADDLDVVAITVHLHDLVDRLQYGALRRVRGLQRPGAAAVGRAGAPGATWQELAARLQVRSRQAAEQAYHRLMGLFESDGARNPQAGRLARGRPAGRPGQGTQPGGRLPTVTGDPVRQLAAELVRMRRELPEGIAEDLWLISDAVAGGGPFVTEIKEVVRDIWAAGVAGPARDAADRLAVHLGLRPPPVGPDAPTI
jgi:hypothetical protein